MIPMARIGKRNGFSDFAGLSSADKREPTGMIPMARIGKRNGFSDFAGLSSADSDSFDSGRMIPMARIGKRPILALSALSDSGRVIPMARIGRGNDIPMIPMARIGKRNTGEDARYSRIPMPRIG